MIVWFIFFISSLPGQKPLPENQFYIAYTTSVSQVSEPFGCFLERGNTKTQEYKMEIATIIKDEPKDLKDEPEDPHARIMQCGVYLGNLEIDYWGNLWTFANADILKVYRMYFMANNSYHDPISAIQLDIALDGIVLSQNHLFVVGSDDDCPGKCVYQYVLQNQTLDSGVLTMDLGVNLYYIHSAVSARFFFILHTRDKNWKISRWRMGSWEDTPLEQNIRSYVSDNPQGALYIRDQRLYVLLIDDLECEILEIDLKLENEQKMWGKQSNLVGLQDYITVDFLYVWYALVRNETEGVYKAEIKSRVPAEKNTLDLPVGCSHSPYCDIRKLIPRYAKPLTDDFSKYRNRSVLPISVVWGLFALCIILLGLAVFRYVHRERSGSFFWGKYRLFTNMQDYDFQESKPTDFLNSEPQYSAPDLIVPITDSVKSDVPEEDLRKRRADLL